MREYPVRQHSSPVVSVTIFLNLLVFGAWYVVGPKMEDHFLVSWNAIEAGRFWVIITSVYSHSNPLHILLNMMVLNSFGPVLEQFLGSRLFFRLYIFAGILGSVFHAAVSNHFMSQPGLQALGASGAISGIVMAFSMMFPRHIILLLGFIPVPALLGALIAVSLDLWGVIEQTKGGGLPIGHGAHLGGALAGAAVYLIWIRGLRRTVQVMEEVF